MCISASCGCLSQGNSLAAAPLLASKRDANKRQQTVLGAQMQLSVSLRLSLHCDARINEGIALGARSSVSGVTYLAMLAQHALRMWTRRHSASMHGPDRSPFVKVLLKSTCSFYIVLCCLDESLLLI